MSADDCRTIINSYADPLRNALASAITHQRFRRSTPSIRPVISSSTRCALRLRPPRQQRAPPIARPTRHTISAMRTAIIAALVVGASAFGTSDARGRDREEMAAAGGEKSLGVPRVGGGAIADGGRRAGVGGCRPLPAGVVWADSAARRSLSREDRFWTGCHRRCTFGAGASCQATAAMALAEADGLWGSAPPVGISQTVVATIPYHSGPFRG